MEINDCRLYLNYRIIAKAKAGLCLGLGIPRFKREIAGRGLENADFYKKFKNEAEKEIAALAKCGIKPVPTNLLINKNKKSYSPAMPDFLHIYDPENLLSGDFESAIRQGKGLFLTSSRFKDAKIYKPGANIAKDFDRFYCGRADNRAFDFICIGTNSEAELSFIEKFSGNPPLIILPAYSLINFFAKNKFKPDKLPNFKKAILISALDPFSKFPKYGFSLRNSLAFHLSQEMAILYLSEKSSLSAAVKKFKSAGKPVKIFEAAESARYSGGGSIKTAENTININCAGCDPVQKFIMQILEKENITIDNLLKLSNIKINANDIVKAISILEINSQIERRPGGIIKKI